MTSTCLFGRCRWVGRVLRGNQDNNFVLESDSSLSKRYDNELRDVYGSLRNYKQSDLLIDICYSYFEVKVTRQTGLFRAVR